MNLTNEILFFNHFLIMSDFRVLLYYLHFVFYCTHVRMSYVLNSYLLTYLLNVNVTGIHVHCRTGNIHRHTFEKILGAPVLGVINF